MDLENILAGMRSLLRELATPDIVGHVRSHSSQCLEGFPILWAMWLTTEIVLGMLGLVRVCLVYHC